MEMVFDSSSPEMSEDMFPNYEWNHTPYANAKESILNNALKAKGLGFTIVAFVYSNHAGDTITQKSRTGFIVKLNKAPMC